MPENVTLAPVAGQIGTHSAADINANMTCNKSLRVLPPSCHIGNIRS